MCMSHSNGEIKFNKVMYKLDVKSNILSLQSFIREGYKVVFDDPFCILIDKKTNQRRIIVELDRKANLWKLKEKISSKETTSNENLYTLSQLDLSRLWH